VSISSGLLSCPSIDIIQVFAEKAQNAEKQRKAVYRENGCCKNATLPFALPLRYLPTGPFLLV
jgi:hypothetical protein